MRTVRRFFLFCSLLSSCAAPLAGHAGAWLLEEGTHQLFTSFSHYRSDTMYGNGYERFIADEYRRSDLEFFYEHGYSEGLTIGMKQTFQQSDFNFDTRLRDRNLREDIVSNDINGLAWREQRYFARVPIWQNDKRSKVLSAQAELFAPGVYPSGDQNLFGEKRYGFALRVAYGRNVRALYLRQTWAEIFKNTLKGIFGGDIVNAGLSVLDEPFAPARNAPPVVWQRFRQFEASLEQASGPGVPRRLKAEETFGFARDDWFFWTRFSAEFTVNGDNKAAFGPGVDGDYDIGEYAFTAGRAIGGGTAVMLTFTDAVWGRNIRDGSSWKLSVVKRF